LFRGHGAVEVVALRDLRELAAEGIIVAAEERAGGAATIVAAAGEIMEHGVVLQGVPEGGEVLACHLTLPELREAPHVSPGGFPPPVPHQLLQMRGVEVDQRLPLQPEK
jgi:hypothetical protein